MKDPNREREKRKYEHPIASREAILTRMQEIAEPVSFKRLAKEIGIENRRDRESLKLRLRAMVRDGQIVGDRRNVYAIAGRLEMFAGQISAHPDGYGFLICDDDREDIFLTHRQMRAVFHGDRAMVRVRGRDRRGRDEGEIVDVLARNTTELVGRVYFENRIALLESLNKRIDHEILIENPTPEVSEGQIVVAEIVEQPHLHGLATVNIVSVLGEHLTPDMEVEIALRNHDIPFEFPDDVIAEVDALPFEVKPHAKRQREDLRQLDFVTIDGADARDFDDAVYCEKRRGGYRLFVAIADVANYVKPGSDLDQEAYKRGTSVYFPQYVVPMLPEKLSNGLCSLNPEVDRLVMVCEMTLSDQGRIGSYQFYEGVIHSKERLTYTTVGEWIEQAEFPRHKESLSNLVSLAKTLIDGRGDRGALDFDTREVGFEFDDAGRVAAVGLIQRNFAHRLIEECMLCANVCAARLVSKSGLPGLYRVHEEPEAEKIAYLKEFLATFGIDLGQGKAEDYQFAIRALGEKQNSQILQIALLRSMQQAVYQAENRGHFGLGYSHYTHFTSPIRRYPDLLVHRLIKSLIHSDRDVKEVRRFGKSRLGSFYPYETETVITQGEHSSFTERRADEAVYEVLEWVKCDYLSDRVGDDFHGVISAVTKFGFFVQLEDVLVEGLVHVSTLTGDYYHFEAGEQSLVGERTNTAFGLGDLVSVQVASVDVDERKVDLELLTHSPIRRLRKSKSRDKRKKEGFRKSQNRHRGAASKKKGRRKKKR
ncbi:MAG: ribonuclease R [Pseudomonadales bacterium]|nr:ribonuclease R [Pseudomonadales bacterium]MBO6657269.1 ribonuclease R [Pseudomonadales bacterium]